MMPTVTCAPWKPVSTKKRRAEQVGIQVQAVLPEGGELEVLAAHEDGAQQRRGEQPDAQAAVIAALDRGQRQHHRQAAHQQHEGADRRVRDAEDARSTRRGGPTRLRPR